MKIKGQFSRVNPVEFSETSGNLIGWVVISHHWVNSKRRRRLSYGKWFRIKSPHTKIYRILRFSPRLKYSKEEGKGELFIDWLGWIDLWDKDEQGKAPIELEISQAKWWEYPYLALSHPDPAYRLAGALAILSVILGIISIILGITSLF